MSDSFIVNNKVGVRWINVGTNFQGYVHKGNHPLIWIGADADNIKSSLRILIVNTRTSAKAIANGVKRVLANTANCNLKNPDMQNMREWIQTNRENAKSRSFD